MNFTTPPHDGSAMGLTAPAPQPQAAAEPAPLVLLVDEDEDFLTQVRHELEALGYAVATARGRAEAEARLAELRPAAAVLEVMMEEPDGGFVLAHQLKLRRPPLPVVLVTAVTSKTGLAFDSADPAQRAWLPADAILQKPVRFEQLAGTLARLLRNGNGNANGHA